MDDEIKEKLQQTAEKADLEFDEVEEQYKEQLSEMQDALASSISDEELRRNAAMIVHNDVTNIVQSGGYGGGETEELPVLSLGYKFREADYFVTEGDGLVGLGIINPSEDPAGVSTFVLDSADGVSIETAKDAFEPLTTTRAYVSRRQIGSRDGEPTVRKGGNATYVCNSTDESKFEVVNPDEASDSDPLSELPSDREAKRDLIHEHFITDGDHVSIANYAEHLTEKNGNGFEVAFGIDVKRFRGQVVDVYSDSDSGFGVMTMLDDNVTDESDVDDELVTDQMRTPGLQVMMDPSLLQYGENSILDVYGFIEQRNDDGQYRMQGFGSIPIVQFDREFDDSGSSSGADDDDIEEDTLS